MSDLLIFGASVFFFAGSHLIGRRSAGYDAWRDGYQAGLKFAMRAIKSAHDAKGDME
jgi:hypothetical protein